MKFNFFRPLIFSLGIGAGSLGTVAVVENETAKSVPKAPEPTKVITDEEDGTQITPEGFEFDPEVEAARLETEQAKLDQQRQAHHDSAKFYALYALIAAGLGGAGAVAPTLSGKSKKTELAASIGRLTTGAATKNDLFNLLPYIESVEDISKELKNDSDFPSLIQGTEGLSRMFRLVLNGFPKQVCEYKLPLIIASSGNDIRFGFRSPDITISANAFPGILKRIPAHSRDLISTLFASETEKSAETDKLVLKASWQAVSTGQPPATKADWLNIIPHVKSIKRFDDQLTLDLDPVALGIPQKKRGAATPLTISLSGGLSRDGQKVSFQGPEETKQDFQRFNDPEKDIVIEILRALPPGIPLEQKRLIIDLNIKDTLPEGEAHSQEHITNTMKINSALTELFADLNGKSLYQALDPKNIESIKNYLDSIKGLSCKAMVASIYDNTVSYLRTNGVIETEYSRTFDQTSFTDNLDDELHRENELLDAFVTFKTEPNEQNTVTLWNLLKAHIVHDGSTPLASPLDDQAYGDSIGQIREHENNFFEKLKPREPELREKLALGLFKVTTKDTSNEDKRHNSEMANGLNYYLSMITKGRNDQTKIANIYTRIAGQLKMRGVIESYIPFELTKNRSDLITSYSMFTDDSLRTKVKNFWAGLIGHIIANSSKDIEVLGPKVTKVDSDSTDSELSKLEKDLFANVTTELYMNNPEGALNSVRIDDTKKSMIPYLKLVGVGSNREIKVAAIYERVQQCLKNKGVINRILPFDRFHQNIPDLIDGFAAFEQDPTDRNCGTFWRRLTAYANSRL